MPMTLSWGAPPVSVASPVFSGVSVTGVTPTSVTISWSVSPASQGQVEYDVDSGAPYASASTLETGYLPAHSQLITGLTPGTTYYFRIKGTSAAAVDGYANESSFTTTLDSGFDAGVTYSATYDVPTGSGWTDGSDCYTAHQAWWNAVPSGASAASQTLVRYAAGFTWIGSNGIDLTGKSNITIKGGGTETTYGHTGGAIIRTTGSPSAQPTGRSSTFFMKSTSSSASAANIRFHGLTLEGNHTTYATSAAGNSGQDQHGICADGVNGMTVAHCIIQKVKGDCVYLSDSLAGFNSTGYYSRDVTLRNSTFRQNGRMLVAIVWAQRVTMTDITFSDACFAAIDVEPDWSYQVCGDISLVRPVFGNWGWDPDFTGAPVLITRPSSAGGTFTLTGACSMTDWSVTGSRQNTSTGRNEVWFEAPWAQFGKSGSLTITGGTRTAGTVPGPVVYLYQHTGQPITITGNTGHLSSGSFVSATSSGTVTQSGNS